MLNTGVTFKCLVSGQTVTFIHQVDIDSMKGHPDYERVEDTPVKIVTEEAPKKVGRSKKIEPTTEVE
jgi:hypothetical protein